ncbi:MAG: hypothetical protein HOW73_45050 [Polyangiaceae bacterium]|nr:hypothetical protein [Polyangiaceae bacterium]
MDVRDSTRSHRHRPTLLHIATTAIIAAAGMLALVDCGDSDNDNGGSNTGNSNGNGGANCPPNTTSGTAGSPSAGGTSAAGGSGEGGTGGAPQPDPFMEQVQARLEAGRQTFRYDTFGDEEFWGGELRLHDAIKGETLGGVGPGVSPTAALELGLKVDMDSLPAEVVAGIQDGTVDLNDPASTVALLQLNAVVGVTGFFDADGALTSMGIQCALCHSTVDNAFAPGVGHRLDGWPNRDLNVGAIVASAPDLSAFATLLGVDEATVRTVLNSWGPGKFDAELILDGKAFRPDGLTAATLMPPAFGQSGVNLHTYSGWGSTTHWNGFVANLEMHGKGTFYDPRLDDPVKFPIAAANNLGHIKAEEDLVTGKLGDLHLYQLSLVVPTPPPGHFDPTQATAGAAIFNGKAQCANCHVPPLFTEPGWNMHTPEEIGIDDFQATRAPDNRYRTTPLRALFVRETGGFYHDGRFATYADVIDHYDTFFNLQLTPDEKLALTEYLKSL